MVKNAILLAGGLGTRLLPYTSYCSKQLIGVNKKPIIEYPINTLKEMGVENLTIIVGSSFSGQILDYIQDGSKYGLNINYCYQPKADGIASAINLCKRFVSDSEQFAIILGDNLFSQSIIWEKSNKAQVVLYKHNELQRFGVATLKEGEIIHIEEKPQILRNDLAQYAITGCYLFDQKFFEYFKQIKPSARGEFEVAHIIDLYRKDGLLDYSIIDGKWIDMGTHEAIAEASDYLVNEENANQK